MKPHGRTFGEVADLYDRVRPSYPKALVRDVLQFSGRQDPLVLEVGGGTGKATALFAPHARQVTVLEPDASMAAVARRTCAELKNVTIEETSFESWRPKSAQRWDLLISGQAWHWVSPKVRCTRAMECLSPNGVLALFWYRQQWEDEAMHEALQQVYTARAPDLVTRSFPGLKDATESRGAGWRTEIEISEGFENINEHSYADQRPYIADDYLDLLRTQSDHHLLEKVKQRRLLEGVRNVVEATGGKVSVSFRFGLFLARRRSA